MFSTLHFLLYTSSMGLLNYREVDWDDIGSDSHASNLSSGEALAWAISLIIIFGFIMYFVPFKDLLITSDELVAKYPRSHEWLNRCDISCEGDINVSYLAEQRTCSALNSLFSDDSHPNLFSWRLAIDDRASAIGCAGFPNDINSLSIVVQQNADGRDAVIEQERLDREQSTLDEKAMEIQLYERSLSEGDLLKFISSVARDSSDLDTVILTTTSAFDDIAIDDYDQIADVIWQKWAVIHSPRNPEQSKIIFKTQ